MGYSTQLIIRERDALNKPNTGSQLENQWDPSMCKIQKKDSRKQRRKQIEQILGGLCLLVIKDQKYEIKAKDSENAFNQEVRKPGKSSSSESPTVRLSDLGQLTYGNLQSIC